MSPGKLILVTALTASLTSKAQLANDNPLKERRDSVVDKAARSWLRMRETKGIIIGVITPRGTSTYHYGAISATDNSLPHDSLLYECGALSNIFCAHLVNKAISEGKLKAGDDALKLLGWDVDRLDGKLTITSLLTHRSGLPNVPDNIRQQQGFDSLDPYAAYSERALRESLRSVELPKGKPAFLYSSYGYALLGAVCAKIYGMPYDEVVRTAFTSSLKMKRTSVSDEVSACSVNQGHDGFGQPARCWRFNAFSSTGGLKSCMADLVTFMRMQLQGSFSKAEDQSRRGWLIKPMPADTLFWHNGLTGGFSTFAGMSPSHRYAVIVLSNTAVSVERVAIPVMNALRENP